MVAGKRDLSEKGEHVLLEVAGGREAGYSRVRRQLQEENEVSLSSITQQACLLRK